MHSVREEELVEEYRRIEQERQELLRRRERELKKKKKKERLKRKKMNKKPNEQNEWRNDMEQKMKMGDFQKRKEQLYQMILQKAVCRLRNKQLVYQHREEGPQEQEQQQQQNQRHQEPWRKVEQDLIIEFRAELECGEQRKLHSFEKRRIRSAAYRLHQRNINVDGSYGTWVSNYQQQMEQQQQAGGQSDVQRNRHYSPVNETNDSIARINSKYLYFFFILFVGIN